MPAIPIAIAAAAAGYGAALALGLTAGTFSFFLVAAAVGSIVSVGLSYAFGLNRAPKRQPLKSTATDTKVLVRGSVESRRVIYGQARVSGPILYAASSGTDQKFLHLVIALAGHEVEEIGTVFIDDSQVPDSYMTGTTVTTGRYATKVVIEKFLGNQTYASARLMSESPDGWSSDHQLRGIAYLYLRLEFDRTLFQGIPNISAIVKGKKDILDPRDDSTGWTDNWALCVLDYLRGDHGFSCDDDELDIPYFEAAANLSDEQVELNESGSLTQSRYTLNGSFTRDRTRLEVMEEMLDAGGGALVYVQGRYRLYGGAYTAPTATLTTSDFAGPIKLSTRRPKRELFNAVKGTFVDPSRYYQASEFTAVTSSTFEAEDGERIWRDVEMPWIQDNTRAQRIARQLLLRERNPITMQVSLRYASLALAVWDTVAVTVEDFGFASKPFRLVSFDYNPAEGTIDATLREEQASSYAWLWDDAAAEPDVPDTTLISPLDIPAPTGVVVTPSTVLNADGAAVPALVVTWTAAAHAFVTSHEVQWRISPSGDWSALEVPAGTDRAVISPVIAEEDYDVRVRAVAALVRSPWSSTVTETAEPDTTAPGVPTSLSALGVTRGVSVSWTNPTDPDLDRVEVQEDGGSGWVTVGNVSGSRFLRTGLAPGDTASYRVRAIDRTGNASAYTSSVSATVPRLLTDDIQSQAISVAAYSSGSATVTTAAPGSGVAFDIVATASVTVTGDRRVLIFVDLPRYTITGASGGAGGDSGDGGGGGGGAE